MVDGQAFIGRSALPVDTAVRRAGCVIAWRISDMAMLIHTSDPHVSDAET